MGRHVDQSIVEALHAKVRTCSELSNELNKIRARLKHVSTQLALAAAGRDAIAALVLPEGKTLTEAWKEDLFGMRTCGTHEDTEEEKEEP